MTSTPSSTGSRPILTPVLLILLALLSSFTPLSIDMYLPALPVIAVDLKGTAGDIQLTLSAFMIAFGVGQIFYGPAGDRFGRRPVILLGLSIYVVTSIGCAFAVEAGHLVGLRFLQGLAACGGVVLILTYLRLPETLRPEYRQPLVLSSILKRFGELFRHKAFMGYAFTSSFQFAALFSFLSGSPFVFIERYGVAPRDYGLIFGGMIVFMTVGSLLNARFVRVFGADKILRYAVIVPAVAGPTAMLMGWIEARYGAIGMWPFLLCFAPQIATISLIGPNSMAMALQRYPHMAGTASSLMGVMTFGLGAVFGAVVGQALDGTIVPMTTAMGLAGILCLLSNRLLVPRR